MAIPWVLFDVDGVVQGVRDGWLQQLTAAGGDRGQFSSFALGQAQPEPSHFAEMVDRLHVAADDVLFLDDHPANVDGAREAGPNAELFPRGGGASALAPVLAAYRRSLAP